ncbi:hypothetical protein JAAARDRAFT_136902 [Jaapia argillacea MUCL 33604]|uniref:Dickkopf N-terminal cysteine-rich domain-containing protein n=1 Tax=Jaapia argillacea MUCL 33604 TaxID=933084 RepID=A0A067PQF8_9AGAM|nr:hypothetical protein JAAARDRAFT_136902 [Jaapia argillacea MUCL 33604]
MFLLPSTLLFLTAVLVDAGSVAKGGACNPGDSRLQTGTYQFWTDCDSVTYCAANNTCVLKGCRRDIFPFGYSQDNQHLPNRCPAGQFCPDEEDACQALLPVGSPCQLNRDDECQPPPNYLELADTLGRGLNFNGSVCLNAKCMWANVTVGQPCVVENTPYIGYTTGGEFINIVSRDNCKTGSYCDTTKQVCMQTKDLNAACGGDKECTSYNCLSSGVCGKDADTPNTYPTWIYVILVIAMFGGMFGTLFGMFYLHGKQRDTEREKRVQYWREQVLLTFSLLSRFLSYRFLPDRMPSAKTSSKCGRPPTPPSSTSPEPAVLVARYTPMTLMHPWSTTVVSMATRVCI